MAFANSNTHSVINIAAFKALMFALINNSRTRGELINITGLAECTVAKWINILHAGKDKLIYIDSWERYRSAGPWIAQWKFGPGLPDATRPKKMSQAEYSRRWRARIKSKSSIIQIEPGVIRHVIN